MTVDEYMQQIKTKSDALALLGSPLDPEDITDYIFDGLSDDFKQVADSVQNRDTPISFIELHEKLLNRENTLASLQSASTPFPATANHAHTRNKSWNKTNYNSGQKKMLSVINKMNNAQAAHTWVNAKPVEHKATVPNAARCFDL